MGTKTKTEQIIEISNDAYGVRNQAQSEMFTLKASAENEQVHICIVFHFFRKFTVRPHKYAITIRKTAKN